MRVRTRNWSEITLDYEELEYEEGWNIEPLVDLARFIESSPYAKGIFGATSHADLLIGRVQDFERWNNELVVKYNSKAKTFTFTYFQRPDDRDPWETSCDAKAGIEKFEFIVRKRLGWFGPSRHGGTREAEH